MCSYRFLQLVSQSQYRQGPFSNSEFLLVAQQKVALNSVTVNSEIVGIFVMFPIAMQLIQCKWDLDCTVDILKNYAQLLLSLYAIFCSKFLLNNYCLLSFSDITFIHIFFAFVHLGTKIYPRYRKKTFIVKFSALYAVVCCSSLFSPWLGHNASRFKMASL